MNISNLYERLREAAAVIWKDEALKGVRYSSLNSTGVLGEFVGKLGAGNVGAALSMMESRDTEAEQAYKEYHIETHTVMYRPPKSRKGRPDYQPERLPRNRPEYINEIAVFFMFGKPLRWSKVEGSDKAFALFEDFLKQQHFDSLMRRVKRVAGSETQAAKYYHIYRNAENEPQVKSVVLAHSGHYRLRTLFDQYGTLQALGYLYHLRAGGKTVSRFDVLTAEAIFECERRVTGWHVSMRENPIGKIPAIYYRQEKEWRGAQRRIVREEDKDSRMADTNNYFADPIAKASADVINQLARTDTPGKMIQLSGANSTFDYINPPTASELSRQESERLDKSILYDTFTPDFSFENMSGMGTLSGEAAQRAMALGFLKRDNRMEEYGELIDRDVSVILAILGKVLHPEMAADFEALKVKWELVNPFEDVVQETPGAERKREAKQAGAPASEQER